MAAPEQAEGFLADEHLVDRYMVARPFSAMCAYRRTALPGGTVARLASMHALVREGSTLFRLYAADTADAALAGEIDLTNRDLLRTTLSRADLGHAERPLILDGYGLTFIDHRGLLVLRDYARRRGTTVVLRTANPVPAWLIEVLDLDGIRVEEAA